MFKFFIFLFLNSVIAHADCQLELHISNVNLVWSATLPTQQITFQVEKKK